VLQEERNDLLRVCHDLDSRNIMSAWDLIHFSRFSLISKTTFYHLKQLAGLFVQVPQLNCRRLLTYGLHSRFVVRSSINVRKDSIVEGS